MADIVSILPYTLQVNGNGQQTFRIKDSYQYITIFNNNPYSLKIFNATDNQQLLEIPNFFIGSLPLGIPVNGMYVDITVQYTGVGNANIRIIFSDRPLTSNQLTQVVQQSQNMIITGDTVGLAKQSQLPANLTANGNLKTAIQEFTAAFSYRNITATGAVTVKTGSGILRKIIVGDAGSGMVITIYDNTTNTGNTIATIKPTTPTSLIFDCNFTTGLTINVTATTMGNITVVYQ